MKSVFKNNRTMKNKKTMEKDTEKSKTAEEKKEIDSLEVEKVGTFIVSKSLQKEIDYLHAKVGNTEWSGILMYSTDTKDISAMENLQFTGQHVFLMDIGNGAATEFDYDKDVIDMYDKVPDAMENNIGLIHSHHSMGAYHSSTDNTEMKENAKHYNYYISLVVDFKRTYKCKVAFYSQTKIIRQMNIKNYNGEAVEVYTDKESELVIMAPLDVVYEAPEEVDEWVEERYKEIKSKPKVSNVKPLPANWKNENYYNKGNNYGNNNTKAPKTWMDEDYNEPTIPQKNIMFALSLLTGNETSLTDIAFPSEIMRKVTKDQVMEVTCSSENLEIIHENVYGEAAYMNIISHVDSAIEWLSLYKNTYPLISRVLAYMKSYKNNYNAYFSNDKCTSLWD